MPSFTFQCPACGFEFTRRMAKSAPPECPACSEKTSQKMSTFAPVIFEGKGEVGAQTTGVASVDYDDDRAVAAASKKAWESIAGRYQKKVNVLADNPGKTGYDLGISPDREYYVMPDTRKKVSEDTRKFVEEIKVKAKVDKA